MTAWDRRYPKGGKRCRCRFPGCKVRRDTPQQIRQHRKKAHGEVYGKAKANPGKKAARRALPSKPGMAKVRRKKAATESPYRQMVKVMARDVMQEIVAQMEER